MERSKFCGTVSEWDSPCCPVCGIPFEKTKKDLDPEEVKVWHTARNVKVAGSFFIFMAVFVLIIGVIAMGASKIPIFLLVFLLLSLFLFKLGIDSRRFRPWAYWPAIVIAVIGLLLSLRGVNILGILIYGAILFVLANKRARKLFIGTG